MWTPRGRYRYMQSESYTSMRGLGHIYSCNGAFRETSRINYDNNNNNNKIRYKL